MDNLPCIVPSRDEDTAELYKRSKERFSELESMLKQIQVPAFNEPAQYEFNNTYHQPEMQKLQALREAGFASQPMPNARAAHILDFAVLNPGAYGYSRKRGGDNPLSWNASQCVKREEPVETSLFPLVLLIKRTSWWIEELLSGDLKEGELWGLTAVDYKTIGRSGSNRNIFLYHVGAIVPRIKPEEKKAAWEAQTYEQLFGFQPVTDEQLGRTLNGTAAWTRLREHTQETVMQTIPQDTLAVYMAARETSLFSEITFMTKDEDTSPILLAKTDKTGNLRIPIYHAAQNSSRQAV